ncbi:DnaB-like helicase N-terminal domain-containing protein [Borreliella garinii]|uniref:DnaB-like helicase N-terminal domain-containing protein n=1 Tax=Borreliella garinii TaxID=29519 RepID=UPI00292D86AE|nr:DnaB-like helicase N-terminal domain-containing protein [Borreliella garinii]WNZ74038.1 DnaB-like helicase N-terminal domain-containing protein [Borreliella garinii]WNZ75010.1 DnaB-like helicase N-terminal domain-containing protein [Borreliella garinii]
MSDNYLKNAAKKFNLSNLDSESIVIGSLLNNTVEIEEVLLHLRAGDFSSTVNQKIFSCIVDLHRKGSSIDPIIVFDALEKNSKSNKRVFAILMSMGSLKLYHNTLGPPQ